ncbi:MAG: hypothetical protein C4541_03395, partial [Candidatus Auribacter fodinae]
MRKYILGFFLSCFVMMCASSLHAQTDSDNDGMPDDWETQYSLNPLSNADAEFDNDSDRLKNLYEYQHGTNPLLADTDNDGLSDGDEVILIGDEFRISTDPPSRLSDASISSDGRNYFMTWRRYWSDEGIAELCGQFYDNDGKPLGSEFLISNYTSVSQYAPSVSSNGFNYLVTWAHKNDQDESDYDLYACFYDNDGIPLGSEFRVNAYTTDYQGTPSISTLESNYLVVWESWGQDGSAYGIYGRIYDNDGNPVGSEFQINTHTPWSQHFPSVSSNGFNYLVTWENNDNNEQDLDDYGVSGCFYDKNGNRIGSQFQINTYTMDSQGDISVSSNGSDYLVTWESWRQDGDGYGIYGQFIDNDGLIGSEFQINTYTTNWQDNPSVSSNGFNYLVTWTSPQEEGHYGTYGRFYDIHRNPMGLEFHINTTGWSINPTVLSNGSGYLVASNTKNKDGAQYEKCIKSIPGCSYYGSNPLVADTDNDGLTDGAEVHIYSTNPFVPDTDQDLLTDYYETIFYGTSPITADTDNDSMPDGWEIKHELKPLFNDASYDNDNDGLLNSEEYKNNILANNSDTDNDGLTDGEEVHIYSTSPKESDTDNEGISDFNEVRLYNTNPLSMDTDKDLLTDYEEVFVYNSNPLCKDTDADKILDYVEIHRYSTSPVNADTDNDGLFDSDEIINLLSNEFQINNYTRYNQNCPSTSSNGSGYLITWQSQGPDGDEFEILGRFFDNDGNPIESEFQINIYTTNWQYNPSVSSNGTNYLVIWQSRDQDGSGHGIYGQFYDVIGNPIGLELRVNTYTTNDQSYPSVSSNGFNYLVTWQSYN